MDGLITNIQRFSIHDGPGIRSTVFLSGCPLSCLWCHNPEAMGSVPEVLFFHSQCAGCKKCVMSCPHECFEWHDKIIFSSYACNQCGICIDNCPAGALKWSCRRVTSDDIMAEVLKDESYYNVSHGGITLSGGEPLRQLEFAREIAEKAKLSGLHTAIETSGCVETSKFMGIIPYIDLFLYDIKSISNDLHLRYTKKSNELILANFRALCRTKKEITVRVPLIPGITNRKKNLLEIENFVQACRKNIEIEYLPFNQIMTEKYRLLGKTDLSDLPSRKKHYKR